MFPAPFKLHTFINTDRISPLQPCVFHPRKAFFLLLIYGIHFCQYAAQPGHGNLLIHVLAPGLG